MAAGSYRIVDEPAPSALGRFAANPFWIVLVGMLLPGGFGSGVHEVQPLVLLWFSFNSFALSSPTRRAEILWAIAGVAVVVAFHYGPFRLMTSGLVDWPTLRAALPYLAILRSALDLTVLYRLFLYQAGPYQLYRYLNPDRA
jgi:hypothetical protein